MAYVPASKLIDINALEEFRKKSQWTLSRDSDSVVLTGPKGETTSVDVGAISTDKINTNTKIQSLQSDTVTIKNTLTAHGARITTLETDSLEVNRKLTADEADIADLKANALTADSADIRYAAIDDLDAVNASIQSLETTKLSANDADIKYATIQNLSVATGRIDTLESTALTTDTADIRYASITNLNAATARISDLETTALTTDTADIRYATIANLNTEKARIDTLETTALTADTADLRYAAIDDLDAATARIGTLESDMITADQADLKYATIQNLDAANANIQNLQTNKLDATDLTAYQATVSNLLANKADIDLANIGTGVIKTAMIENGAITTALIGTGAVDTAQIADGSITDGKIVSLSATKISAGTLDAANIDVVHLNAASITVGQINGTQIANGAIDLDQLSSGVANTISSNTANVTQALNDIGVLQDDVGVATADAQSAKSDAQSARSTADAALAKINEAIQEVDVEYAVGDSSSTAPTTGWSTDSPQWQAGKFIWQRTKVVDGDDNISYSDPTCIQGAKGQDGQDGQDGKDGVSPTISASKTGTVTTLTITDSNGTSTATINDGAAGSRGTSWYAGTAITGTSTTATVFSGSGVTTAIVGDHYLNTSTQNVYICKKKGNASTATWAYEMNIKGADGTPGTNGTDGIDGKTAYLHVKYSNDGGQTFTGNSGEDAGTYIGTYSDNTQADSTSVSDYTWIKIEGEDGADGVSPTVVASKSGTVTTLTITDINGTRTATVNDGTNGSRGTSWYAGTGVTGTSTTAAIFSSSGVSSAIVGDHYLNTSTQNVYICKKAGNASTATWAYEMNIKGTDGTDGTNGIDGKTAYLHVKYSDDGGVTFTGNSGEDTGAYIGTYSDNTQADSTSVSAYKWVKIEGKDGTDGVSPTIVTSKSGTVTTLTITDVNGTRTATVNDGTNGSRGATWYAGTAITGTSTSATIFSGSGVSSAIVGDHYLNTSTQNVYVCAKAGNASTATWKYEQNIKGASGTPGTNGTNGTDGKSAYLHVKYSNDGGTTFTSNSGEDTGSWIGTYTDDQEADSTSVSAYKWVKIEGTDGKDGKDGEDGARGATWYAGTKITGTSTSATKFTGSGITSAITGDHYLNTSTQNVYVCVTGGNASTATWKYEQNIKGATGTPGTNGTDGSTAYFHVKYSNDGGVTFTGNSGEDPGSYIGTYSDNTAADSTSVSKYTWVKIEGTDGKDGDRGATWYAGTAITGTSTTATKFTGSGITSAITGDHYLNTSTQNVYICVTGGNASTATWKYEQNIKGATGTPGTNGTDGSTAYFHVKYSNDGGTTFTSNSGEDPGTYIGTYSDNTATDSTSVSKYTWVKIEGTDGKDGKDGDRGATWYAGTKITGTSTTATKFTGSGITSAIAGDHYLNTSTQNVYVCVVGGNASTATWKYEQNIKGATGAPGTDGTNGTDGKTAYMHVKYSNDGGATFTGNSGEDPGSYIGTYSDNTAADSTSVSKYTWVRIEGIDGEDGVSPIITSSKSGTVTTITITDASGTKTATLNDGAAGARGATWYAGTKITGTSTTAAVFSGSGISSAIVGDHYLNTSTQNVYVCKKAGNASTATWAYEENIKGETGQAGTNGTNGKTAYFHVKYSNDGGATFTGNSGEDTGTYIGTYSDNNATDSTSVSAYKWVKIEGIDGEDGVSPTITTSKTGSVSTITIVDALGTKRVNINDGVAGARGATWYAGTAITGTSTTAAVFSGSGITNAIVGDHYLNTATQNVYVCAKAGAASTATWKYEQNIKGATGATGPTGPDGKTAYFHVKYSNDGGKTFTANSGETAGTYIGTYTDNTAADSTSVSKYTWVKIEGIDGEDGISITKVEEQYYLSTSDTTQTGGSWSTTQPAWSSGKYIWTRSHITFSNNTTSNTTPVLAKAINSANTTANSANTTAQSANTTANSAKTAADNAVLVATTAQTSADKALSSTEIIIGTQTASTGAWTGNASFATLEDGQSIIYWLPFAGSGNATLNLTLSTGLTTGAKNCYYSGASRLSTHYAAGNAIRLTYMKAANVNGTSYEGWWADANQNTDTYDRVRYNWSITAASAITAGELLVADSNGKYKPLTTASFDVSKPILWAGSAIAASKTGTNNYIAYPNVNVTVTKSGFTGTNLATLYLYGTLSGSTFTPNANLFTTTVPTSMTTDTYIAVGQMRSTTACYLYPEHPMYRYYNGKFQSITQLAYEAFISADTAQDKADAAQQTADSASGTANTALQTANGKNKVFHQTSAPATGMQTNDTWFDTNDGYKMYRYNGSSWVAEQFNSNAIADAAITNAKIKDATIQSAKIAALDAGKITTGTLAADRIGANSITAAKIATGTITSTQIAAGTIKASNIATGSITADLIGAGVISADHLASNSITSDKIVSGAVTAAKIASKTITANEIASNAITADKIASNAVTAAKISAGAVTAVKIESNAVTADKIAAGAVTAAKINVSDLYALGATIGGFVINETSIASKDKSTNGGIQLNKDGSVDIGDSNSYIRYADGNLDMRVTSLTIGGSGVATAAQLTNMSDTVNSIATAANTTANSALVRADDAAKTATNFLHYDSVYGLVVTQSPVASASAVANITDSNLRITSDSVDVFKGQKRLARYGANVVLGDEDASNVLIDPSGGLQVRSGADVLGSFSTSGVGLGVSRDNKPYMNINPEAFSIKQIIQVTDDSGSYPQVLDDDIFSISFNSDVTYGELGTESGDVLAMETGEALGYTEGEAIAQLQFGVENDSRGVGTAVFGEGLEAISRYSFAVGRYNKATGTDLFVVGNGNGDSTRSNALTIDKSGLVTIPGRIVNTATPTGNTDLVNKAYVDNAIKALYKLITGNNYPS